ncbi:hypothetical protein H4R21_000974 [Coemansia helicoidea]|uniref:Uncharacterized protein n=1 Tax=Coemansia helicoidea TaxID=1286919 RepID=A0ACC1LDW6_9FUNG|nr:hypothetical protein H4R21_000974 [Coemansia helicoidea]
MASRLAGRAALRAGWARRALHTSGAQGNLFSGRRWGLFQKDSGDGSAGTDRLGVSRRRGGYERGAGMPLYVPVRAKNVEKAWEIWSVHLRQADPAERPPVREGIVDLLMLIVRAAKQRSASAAAAAAGDAAVETPAQRRSVAAFRVVALLRHLFALAVREQHPDGRVDGGEEGTTGIGAIRLGLGLRRAEDYEAIAALLRAAADDGLPSGNSAALDALRPADLAAELDEAPLARVAQALVLAARDDGVPATDGVLLAALEVAVAMQDAAAGRDMLAPGHAHLAALLDPAAPAAVPWPNEPECGAIVETLLRLVAVGRDPHEAAAATADGSQPQPALEYAQLESLVDYGLGEEAPEAAAAVRDWRAAVAERIYRGYVSSGFAEVAAPDGSGGRRAAALCGSVVPTPRMVACLLDAHLGAGHAEQAAVAYEALGALMRELPLQPLTDAAQAAPRELRPAHRVPWRVWAQTLDAACRARNEWLAARILGDMAGDGWAPTQAMLAQYLAAAAGGIEPAVAAVRASLLENGVELAALDVREPLVRALAGPCTGLPTAAAAARAEQALALSGLAAAADGSPAAAAVSEEAACDVIAALIAGGQITRALEAAQAWCSVYPGLATGRCAADLVRGLGAAGRHSEALALFAEVQQAGAGEFTMELLAAVLDVYMHAGDYGEAISVGKRIRALAAADPAAGLPSHATFNHLVQAYCEEMQPGEALHILEEMRRYRLHATPETYTILAIAMSNLRSNEGLRLVAALANVDYNMVPPAAGASSGSPALPLTTDYYNALIEAYGRVAEPDTALQLWELMRYRGIRPDALTATLLIDTCAWNERVHWEDALVPRTTFVPHAIPDDHVYTGMPLMHMHFLADSLAKLRAAGLVFSVAHCQHVIEALVRGMCVADPVDMLIGPLEAPEERAAWAQRFREATEYTPNPLLAGLAALLSPKAARGDGEGDGDGGHPEEWIARSMDDFALDIPLCPETIATVYGALAELRAQCHPDEVGAISRTTLVSETGAPVLLRLIDLQERRLDAFLRARRPDLLPAGRAAAQTAEADAGGE